MKHAIFFVLMAIINAPIYGMQQENSSKLQPNDTHILFITETAGLIHALCEYHHPYKIIKPQCSILIKAMSALPAENNNFKEYYKQNLQAKIEQAAQNSLDEADQNLKTLVNLTDMVDAHPKKLAQDKIKKLLDSLTKIESNARKNKKIIEDFHKIIKLN